MNIPQRSHRAMCPPQAHHGQGGFLSVEAVVMIMALVVLLPLAYAGWNMGFAALKARSVAQQLQQVSEAAKVYARSQALLTSLTPDTNAEEVTGAQLIAAGVLPHSGPDIENAWKQKYKVFYSIPPTVAGVPNRLTVVVVTISDPASPVAEADARKAAGFGGAGVGLVADAGGSLALLNVVGGWRIALNTKPLPSTDPTIGSIGSYASLDDKALNTDVLYRVDVPGRPELNQMHVNLDMRDHAIVDVGNIQFNATSVKQADLTSVCDPAADTEGKVFYHTSTTTADLTGLYACKSGVPVLLADGANSAPVRAAQVVDPGTLITKPICPSGSSPFISVSPASVTVGGLAPVVGTSIYSSYADESATQWRVSLTVLGATLPVAGKLSVITSCSKP